MVLYIVFLIANNLSGIERLLSSTGYSKVGFGKYIRLVLIGENPYGVHLWFIYCLLIVSLIGMFIPRICEKKAGIVIVCFVLMVWILRYVLNPQIVIVLRVMLYGMYYFLGIVWEEIFKSKKGIIYITLSLLAWGLVFWYTKMRVLNIDVSMHNKFLVTVMVCMCIDNIICLCKRLCGKMEYILVYLGKNSFSIYLFHQPFFCAVIATIMMKFQLPYFIIVLCCLSLGVICPLLIVMCVKKYKILNGLIRLLGIR